MKYAIVAFSLRHDHHASSSGNERFIDITCAVLEVYSDWCGPSKAINATCKRIYFDHGDRGLKFYTVQAGVLDFTMPFKGKCEPVFLFFCNGKQLKDLDLVGIDTPKMTSSIMSKLDEITAEA